jgi:DNA-directed RNA polymerase specialized sigma24 family protein
MSNPQSVTCWIEELKAGDPAAAAPIWQCYHKRLVGLARRKLGGAPRRVADEDDVVAQAFESFVLRAQAGKFPDLQDRQDLWKLLVKITERKACNQLRDQAREKRGGGRVRGDSVFGGNGLPADGREMDYLTAQEPTPEFAAMVVEALDVLLRVLEPNLRAIALLKLEGYTNKEIAGKIDRSVPTVERRLKIIRTAWGEEDA